MNTQLKEHIKIIDYTQMPYKYVFSPNIGALFANVDGMRVETTIPAYTIKEIARISEFGLCRTAVVFDSRKSELHRTDIAREVFGITYKDGRKKMPPKFAKGIELTKNLLIESGVSTYYAEGYEADDIIYNLVKMEEQKDVHIDLFTNDSDLLCLVSPNVTVYFRGAKAYGVSTGATYKGYTIVTPENYQEVLASMSAYRGYCIPYNSIYLHKLICGDSTDNIPKVRGYGPSRYGDLIAILQIDRFDFSKATPENFEYIMDFLDNYEFTGSDSGVIEHMYKTHKVMNYPSLMCNAPQRYQIGDLSKVCSKYFIHIDLPRNWVGE